MRPPTNNHVFIYMYGVPRKGSSGAYLRFYSNCRAYLELGFEPEIIQVVTEPDAPREDPELPVKVTRVVACAGRPSVASRIMYRLGYPGNLAARYYYARHMTICREVMLREGRYPGALHQFENYCESTIQSLPRVNAIWSCHDILHDVVAGGQRIDQELDARNDSIAERRELRFVRRFERRIARNSRLILCITPDIRDTIRREWKCAHAEHLPMSIPDVPAAVHRSAWLNGGKLNLLHVGAVAHLSTYRSLELLLSEVFPRLRKFMAERISLQVIGEISADHQRCKRIAELCSAYPQVSLLGKVADLRPFYSSSDLQVVGSTDATGLRTRIVESFAYGLPVLSTSKGAHGTAGMRAGENILLADSPEAWVEALEGVLRESGQLAVLARNARSTYDAQHSAPIVAASLAASLQKYFGLLAARPLRDGSRRSSRGEPADTEQLR